MDFRYRYPDLKHWPYWVLDLQKSVFPYSHLHRGQFHEFPSHDGTTSFLLLHDELSIDDNFWRVYAIEAPKDWHVRHRFENGEISWSEFFQFRGWIAELTGDFEQNSDTHCRYISFCDLSETVKREFKELDADGSPYQILHDQTLQIWKRVLEWGHDASEYQKEYESFIKNHGHKLVRESHSSQKLKSA